MRKGIEMQGQHTRDAPHRRHALSELPVVAALLMTAVAVALLAAGGPVLEMLAGLNLGWSS